MSTLQRKRKTAIELPTGVHRVRSRGRFYYYYTPGRGTVRAGKPLPLPHDAHSVEFWNALRQAQGLQSAAAVDGTVRALTTEFLAHCKDRVTKDDLAQSSLDKYTDVMKLAVQAWGDLPGAALRSRHVQACVDKMPSNARNFVNCLSSFSKWMRKRGRTDVNFTYSIDLPKAGKGHLPWTDAQLAIAASQFTGVLRKGFILYRETGYRGSDIVLLGPTDRETYDGRDGFAVTTQKRKRETWCPIMPALDVEMRTWERRPGPYLLKPNGRPFTRKEFAKQFAAARDAIAELRGLTLHGLRATAVIKLRRAGLSYAQIGDIVGMSAKMVERYCRNADLKLNSRAAVTHLERAMAR
jgi:hypothetical protein